MEVMAVQATVGAEAMAAAGQVVAGKVVAGMVVARTVVAGPVVARTVVAGTVAGTVAVAGTVGVAYQDLDVVLADLARDVGEDHLRRARGCRARSHRKACVCAECMPPRWDRQAGGHTCSESMSCTRNMAFGSDSRTVPSSSSTSFATFSLRGLSSR